MVGRSESLVLTATRKSGVGGQGTRIGGPVALNQRHAFDLVTAVAFLMAAPNQRRKRQLAANVPILSGQVPRSDAFRRTKLVAGQRKVVCEDLSHVNAHLARCLDCVAVVQHVRQPTGTRQSRECAQRLGVRRLDAAFAPRKERCPEARRRGPKVPRRRQTAALQGAFGTGIFRAVISGQLSAIRKTKKKQAVAVNQQLGDAVAARSANHHRGGGELRVGLVSCSLFPLP
jgi:hypothetical protein